jgi:hypothetical protein
LANSALNSAAAHFFFHFAVPRAANVANKGRAENASYSILRDDPADLVCRNPEKREIEQARSFRKPLAFNRNSGDRYDARNVKRKQERVLSQQLFIAFFFFRCLVTVMFDGKIGLGCTMP